MLMRNMYINFRLIVLFLLFVSSAAGQQTTGKYAQVIATSTHIIDSLQKAQKIPGIDIAIAIDGKTVWSQAFGLADVEHNIAVKAGVTKFRIGSVSKPFTTVAIGKLMDDNKVNLDDEVQKYVPDYPKKEHPITVRQVSAHLSGIRHYKGDEFLMNKPFKSVNKSLDIFKDDPLNAEPGSKYIYSTYGYSLLSAVVEGASDQEFLKYMNDNIFGPLGMEGTCADKNKTIISNRTSFYNRRGKGIIINAPTVDNSYKWGGGGFLSTTNDLIKFGHALKKEGFLSQETLTKLTTPQKLNDGSYTKYGIGWAITNLGSMKGYGHNGGSIGGITVFRIFPNEDIIVVALSNSSNTKYGKEINRITKLFAKAAGKI